MVFLRPSSTLGLLRPPKCSCGSLKQILSYYMQEELWPGEGPHVGGRLHIRETWTSVCQLLALLKKPCQSLLHPHEKGNERWKERWNHLSFPPPLRGKMFLLHGTAGDEEKGRMVPMTHKMGPILYRRSHHWVRRPRFLYATCHRWAIRPFPARLEQLSPPSKSQ